MSPLFSCVKHTHTHKKMSQSTETTPNLLDPTATIQRLSYNEVAGKLLRDKLYLTALELHTELLESGREVKQLKDYFSNPGNFETQYDTTVRISRSGSQLTLDSLDFTRGSEDGDKGSEEHVAVLEFELRKAKETINALRNNLTVVTESESNPTLNSPTKSAHSDFIKPHEQRALNFLINEYLLVNGYKLTSITFSDENENQDFEDWDDVGLNISKPPELLNIYRDGFKQFVSSDMQTISCQTDENMEFIETLILQKTQLNSKIQSLESQIGDLKFDHSTLSKQIAGNIKYSDSISSKNSFSSVDSPEKFEIIDKTKEKCPEIIIDDLASNSVSNFNMNEWTNVTIQVEENLTENSNNNVQEFTFQCRNMSNEYIHELKYQCPTKLEDHTLYNSTISTSNISDNFIENVSETLLKVIPNIILNKREEVISLLVSAIVLQNDAEIRDKLLQQLFSLKKKPTENERILILTGIIGIARNAKKNLVENELLPQCCEQIAHKYVERRLLVAETCRYLLPFISSGIRNSLLLSILQQLFDDRNNLVRQSVVQTFVVIIALCDDNDKYNQCEELAFLALKDDCNEVITTTTDILFPALAKWALDIGYFSTHLMKRLLHSLNTSLKDFKLESPNTNEQSYLLRIITVLNRLIPFVLMYVAVNNDVLESITFSEPLELRPELLELTTKLTNPNIFYNGKYSAGLILYAFDKFIAENLTFASPEIAWFLDIMLPDLINSLNLIDSMRNEVFHSLLQHFIQISRAFGSNFTLTKLRPLFQTHITQLEQLIANGANQESLNIIPVYLVAILQNCPNINDNTGDSLLAVELKKFLVALPICGVPADCLEVSVTGLCRHSSDVVVGSLWEGVVHTRPLVRAVTAGLFATIVGLCNDTLLTNKIVPALVTLANDTDILVRTASIPALGRLTTDCQITDVHDKAYMQLQIYLSDSTVHDNHTLLRQLVVTMGNMAITCKSAFRNDVILPQLAGVTSNLLRTSNTTRKVDMAIALIEAYANIIYSPLQSQYILNYVVPPLRNLEEIVFENSQLHQHKDSISSMLREIENRVDVTSPRPIESSPTSKTTLVNQGVEDMKQKVSKLFHNQSSSNMIKSNTLSNLQGLFKKK